VFEELFADNFVDHTPQPNTTPDKEGVRKLYSYMRAAFPDFHAKIHWQLADADGERVTTYKTYHGTHEGPFLGIAPTHPIAGPRRTFVPRDAVTELLAHAPLDRAFIRDIAAATGATIDEV